MVKKIAIVALLAASLIGVEGNWVEKPMAAQPASQLILVNVQLVKLDEANTLLRVQSSGAQAFDRLKSKNPQQVIIRFYRAKIGDLSLLDPPSFGSVALIQESADNALLTIDLASSKSTATVSQGGNPNSVEIRIRH